MSTEKQFEVIRTKEEIEQYEEFRKTTLCNMFDYNSVIHYAGELGLEDLAELSMPEYLNILSNFGKYMAHYDIEQ